MLFGLVISGKAHFLARSKMASSAMQMSDTSSNSGRIDVDNPPFSRIFVVCSKRHTEEDMRQSFQAFGQVEDVWIVKDKVSKESRGVCYIKFSKASAAALAVESMDGKQAGDEPKPLKVMIAQSKSSGSKLDFNDDTALNRLFVVCPRSYTEEDLRCKFEDFGDIEYVQIVRDHSTKEPKGFGYVKFTKASTAAVALENCDKTLKAVMAEPKSAKIARNAAAAAAHMHASYIPSNPFLEQATYASTHAQPASVPAPQLPTATPVPTAMGMEYYGNPNPTAQVVESITTSHTPTRLFVIVATTVTQDQVGRLFDIIPGMEHCELKRNYNTGESKGFAYVTYNSVGSAIYAKEKLHGFEYPPGMKLVVKYAEDPPSRPNTGNSVPGQVRTAGAPLTQNNTPYKLEGNSVYTTAALPAPAPLSDPNSECASRLFLVCNPAPPPEAALKDVFSRFGNLIDVYIMKDRNFGYAKFSAKESAECAIEGLHGHEVLGMRLKVMHADPPKTEASRKRPRT